jgi:hydantoinase/carbamoylase family amidase
MGEMASHDTDEAPRAGEPADDVDQVPSEGVGADPGRLLKMIEEVAEIGRGAAGISRLAFSKDEQSAHELVDIWLSDLGFHVRRDAIGNTIAELPGRDPSLPAIGLGSHLDSVPHGGRFDGVAGVVAAIEVARMIVHGGITLHHPLRVVAFAAEEGARFGEPCIGSKAVAGWWSTGSLDRIRDAEGVTAAEAMRSVSLRPEDVEECQWQSSDWAAFLELHIEQASVLETTRTRIGVVDTVSGSTRVAFSVHGQAQHSGGTPMSLRTDALAAASEMVLFAERLANDPHYRGTRATIGRLDVFPNSITTIPGIVRFVLDVRDTDGPRQRKAASEIVRGFQQLCERRGVELDFDVIADTSPVVLPTWLREILMESSEKASVSYRVMASGAGHDSQIINSVVPAGMVFVPSKGGLSHVPEEWTSATDLATGATVLFDSIGRLDAFLASLPKDTTNGQ